jgi:hypothetical protein
MNFCVLPKAKNFGQRSAVFTRKGPEPFFTKAVKIERFRRFAERVEHHSKSDKSHWQQEYDQADLGQPPDGG